MRFEEDRFQDEAAMLISLSVRRDQLLAQLKTTTVNAPSMGEAKAVANRIISLPWASEYKAAADTLGNGIPSWFIGCLHYREITSMSLKAYLGNGEMIIGTGRKTHLVPKLRGPFATFHEGAVDSLNLSFKGFGNWTDIGNCLVRAEMWNGEGYNHLGVVNPYLFSGTSIYHMGKYDLDGHYNPRLVDQELGIVPIMKALGVI